MQNAETKAESMKKGMVFPNRASFSVWMAMVLVAFLALQAIVVVASAHETGSTHQQLPPPWPYHVLLVTTGVVVMLGGMLTARFMKKKNWWLKTHKSLAISGALLTVSGFILAAYMVSTYMIPIWSWKRTHISELRQWPWWSSLLSWDSCNFVRKIRGYILSTDGPVVWLSQWC